MKNQLVFIFLAFISFFMSLWWIVLLSATGLNAFDVLSNENMDTTLMFLSTPGKFFIAISFVFALLVFAMVALISVYVLSIAFIELRREVVE